MKEERVWQFWCQTFRWSWRQSHQQDWKIVENFWAIVVEAMCLAKQNYSADFLLKIFLHSRWAIMSIHYQGTKLKSQTEFQFILFTLWILAQKWHGQNIVCRKNTFWSTLIVNSRRGKFFEFLYSIVFLGHADMHQNAA